MQKYVYHIVIARNGVQYHYIGCSFAYNSFEGLQEDYTSSSPTVIKWIDEGCPYTTRLIHSYPDDTSVHELLKHESFYIKRCLRKHGSYFYDKYSHLKRYKLGTCLNITSEGMQIVNSPEAKAKSAAHRTDAFRSAISNHWKSYYSSPEVRAQKSEFMKSYYSSRDNRAYLSLKTREAMTPEACSKCADTMKHNWSSMRDYMMEHCQSATARKKRSDTLKGRSHSAERRAQTARGLELRRLGYTDRDDRDIITSLTSI